MFMLTQSKLVVLSMLTLAAPLIALLVALLMFLGKEIYRWPTARAQVLGWTTRLLSIFSLACSVLLAAGQPAEFPLQFTIPGVSFYLDALSVYFVLLVNLVAFFASWYTVDFLAHDARFNEHHEPEIFHIFFNAFHLTMLIVPMVDNLVILWMAVELTTLASTMLVRYRLQRRTLEAAWKYIIITTAGIVFALFGTIFLADAIGEETCRSIAVGRGMGCAQLTSVELLRWSLLARVEVARTLNSGLVMLAFLFALVGYGTKAGFAPMHTWLPDGHGEAPSPVSALLSGVLLKSALYAILRFYTIVNLSQEGATAFTSNVLLFSGLLSLALATPFILKRNKFKRILAYHSLEHMGIITFGIGIGTPIALLGALLHALNHALIKALMFLAFGNVRHAYADRANDADLDKEEEQLTGIMRSMPVSGTVLTLSGLGLVGSPPFSIFFSEFIILWAAFQQIITPPPGPNPLSKGIYASAIALFLITITLIFGGLTRHLARLLLGWPSYEGIREHFAQVAPLIVLLVIVTLFGVWIPTWPVNFRQLLEQSVYILQYGAAG